MYNDILDKMLNPPHYNNVIDIGIQLNYINIYCALLDKKGNYYNIYWCNQDKYNDKVSKQDLNLHDKNENHICIILSYKFYDSLSNHTYNNYYMYNYLYMYNKYNGI